MSHPPRSSPWLLLAVFGVAVAALWVWAPMLLERFAPELSGIAGAPDSALATASGAPLLEPDDCNLSEQACTLSAAPPWSPETAIPIRLEITPRPIPMLESLSITVQPQLSATRDAWPDAFEIDFAGVDMYMGYQRATLRRDGSVWRGTLSLPLCTTQRMLWAATLLPTGEPNAAFAQYRFWTERRRHGEVAGFEVVSRSAASTGPHDAQQAVPAAGLAQ